MEKVDTRLWRLIYRLEFDSQDGPVKGARPGIGKLTIEDAVSRGWVIRVDDRKLDITVAGRAFVRHEVANGRLAPAGAVMKFRRSVFVCGADSRGGKHRPEKTPR